IAAIAAKLLIAMNDSSRRPRRPYSGLVASTEVRRSLLIGPLVPPRLPSLRCAVWWLDRYCRRPKSGSPPTKNASGGRCSIASPIAAFVPFRIHARSHREQRLARCVFNFVRPGLLDAVDYVLRHRDVIELLGHLVALVVGPGEELERLGGRRRILRLLIEQDPSRRRHRPGLGTGLVGENDAVAGDGGPIGIGCSRLERRRGGGNSLAVLVDHLRVGQLVL